MEKIETEPEKACSNKAPDFTNMYQTFIKELEDGNKNLNSININIEFDKANTKYHNYVECIFGFAERKIVKDNFDWYNPQNACLNQEVLKETTTITSPDQMLPPLLNTYNNYTQHLDNILSLYNLKGLENIEKFNALQKLNASLDVANKFERKIKEEKENALVAMNISFVSLKELRLAFTMHVHLQCMLSNLEKYRKLLGDMRLKIGILPVVLEDASMSK